MDPGFIHLIQMMTDNGPTTVLVAGDTAIIGAENISISSDERGPYMDIRLRQYMIGSVPPIPEPTEGLSQVEQEDEKLQPAVVVSDSSTDAPRATSRRSSDRSVRAK